MKVESRDGALEREILTAMLTDDAVCASITSRWEAGGLFRSRWADVVAGWAVRYCKKHGEAPRRHVESLFVSWAKKADSATIALVEQFLQSISDEYSGEGINADYVIDRAGEHFNEVRARKVVKEMEGLLDAGDHEGAWDLMRKADRVEIGRGAGIDVLQDHDAIRRAFENDTQEPLFRYPGAAGEFFGVRDCIHRDCFVAFAGPKGRGKSFWLIDFAWRAMEQRCRVAFFAIGDMSQDQMMRRFMVRASNRPYGPGILKRPVSISKEGDKPHAVWDEESYDGYLNVSDAICAAERVMRSRVKSGQSYMKLSCHPTKSISIPKIEGILADYARKGFAPDVVVIDYADLLAPVSSRDEGRDAINNSWIAMRALAQTMRCLVVTATQTKATSYYTDLINRDHFADDRRKIDHVNAFVGINQTHDERAAGVMRLNFFALREEDFDERKCVTVAPCLAVANPCVRSCW